LKRGDKRNANRHLAKTPDSRSRAARLYLGILGYVALIGWLAAVPTTRAEVAAPLKLEGTIPLSGFTGDFDHFAVDEKGGRVFLAGEDHKTVEV
jgi:hypothetical protein